MLKGALGFCGVAATTACRGTTGKIPHEAMYWRPFGDMVRCELCPNNCTLDKGQTGVCRVRRNDGGKMITLGYSNPCAVHVDPIEKKPLYHVLPGTRAYSVAIAGCCFRCKNCQNWTISQASPLETRNHDLPPEKVVSEAIRHGCKAVAYTYSEPIVWYEWMYDCAVRAREAGLKNLMITCGNINEAPLRQLAPYMDAANIDLKSFDERIYRELNAGQLKPILSTLKRARELGIWVEVTNLVVPEWTDEIGMIEKMCAWIHDNLGPDTPLHFSRFHPQHKLSHLYPTPPAVLKQARNAAHEAGLHHVYVGNLAGVDSTTYCPHCGKPVIERRGYLIGGYHIADGACENCGGAIAGIWKT